MQFSEQTFGRCFVLRLESGEVLHEIVEKFAIEHNIRSALVTAVGGIGPGSKMVVGPELPLDDGIKPIIYTFNEPHELTGAGTLFSDVEGIPLMHMHGSAGRDGKAVTGCLRAGIIAWLVLEVTITELVGQGPVRLEDQDTGFKILEIR